MAVPVAPLVHDPLPVASVRVVLLPAHTLGEPAIAAGVASTVTGTTDLQPPAARVYVITGMPAPTPVTTPVPDTTVANDGLLLVQVPPDGVLLRVVVVVAHTEVVPVIPVGVMLTVNGIAIPQPAADVYEMFRVPLAIPATTPVVFTVPSAVLLLLQVPPVVASVSVVVDPAHTLLVPAIAAGVALTVTGVLIKQPVGSV